MTERQTTSPSRRWLWIVAIGCGALACVMLALLAVLAVGGGLAFLGLREWMQGQNWNPDDEPWIEVAIPLPDGWGQVIFLRQSAHPFLAEYNQKLRLELTGQPPVVVEMPMNVGGSTFTNVYWVAEGVDGHATLQLIDHWGMYVVDLEDPPATALWLTRFEGVWRLNGAAEKTDALLEALDDPEYLGCLNGKQWPLRFVPASEAPEAEIDFVGD
ncbi:MAG: hypothetical protein WHX52_09360 [Anaerolineae bacterium]